MDARKSCDRAARAKQTNAFAPLGKHGRKICERAPRSLAHPLVGKRAGQDLQAPPCPRFRSAKRRPRARSTRLRILGVPSS